MIDTTATQQRKNLHGAIWAIADDLRGSVDGWDFKSYVLGMMFYRYISENLTNYINKNEHDTGNAAFDYRDLSDAAAESIRQPMVSSKGFFILPSELFCNVRKKAPADENLNSRRETKEAGQACVPRKKYEMPRGAINLPRKKQGRASHSLSVGEPGAGFIFFKRNICMPRHHHNLKARHPRPQSVTPANTKAHKENHDRKNY